LTNEIYNVKNEVKYTEVIMKKKWFKCGSIVLAVVVMGFAMLGMGSGRAAASAIEYTELYPSELINSISTKGRVESAEKQCLFDRQLYGHRSLC